MQTFDYSTARAPAERGPSPPREHRLQKQTPGLQEQAGREGGQQKALASGDGYLQHLNKYSPGALRLHKDH